MVVRRNTRRTCQRVRAGLLHGFLSLVCSSSGDQRASSYSDLEIGYLEVENKNVQAGRTRGMGSSDTGHNDEVRRYSIDDILVYVLGDLEPIVYPSNENKSEPHPACRRQLS